MKKAVIILLILTLAAGLCACGDVTEKVSVWFLNPSVSEIDYNLNGIQGNVTFTYHSENSTKLHFNSGEGLEGVEFTFTDGTATAALDGLEWQTTPEMTELLSLFGKLYAHAARQNYKIVRADSDEQSAWDTFLYTDGTMKVTFLREDCRPTRIEYTKDAQTVTLDILDIRLTATPEEEQ